MQTKKRLAGFHLFTLISLIGLNFAISIRAEEGMWDVTNLPVEQIQKQYGFHPNSQWVKHVMQASVKFPGGSGSFISAQGLILTNHHVARGVIYKLSTPEQDYVKNGFYAKTEQEELKTQDLEVMSLMTIEDVTDRVQAAASVSDEVKKIESEEVPANLMIHREVVKLYGGGKYHLYRYKKYTDVRLVFAPEHAIAFFGGDPDNFEFPRYDLDMALLRAYEDGKPAQIKNFFKVSKQGLREGELAFITGHPGRTDRQLTFSQLESQVRLVNPLITRLLESREKSILEYMANGPAQAREAETDLFSIQNGLKVYRGFNRAFADGQLLNTKRGQELEAQKKAQADPSLESDLGVWNEIEETQTVYRELAVPFSLFEKRYGFNSNMYGFAMNLVRIARESTKPNSERLPEYTEQKLVSLKRQIQSQVPVFKEMEKAKLSASLEFVQQELGSTHPGVIQMLAGKTPAKRAAELIEGSQLDRADARKSILEGGSDAIEKSQDSLILLAKQLDPLARSLRKKFETEIEVPNQKSFAKLSKIFFKLFGTTLYPDATSTLRVTYGAIRGYVDPAKGKIAPFTDLGGAFDHSQSHGSEEPYALPSSWIAARDRIQKQTPMNFVSNHDIIGGNSGSPVINPNLELVGLVFDGNIHSLSGNYIYDGSLSRAVSVDVRGILESLRSIYGAKRILLETCGE